MMVSTFSGHKILLLVLIASLQTCLLDARRLRVVRQSTVSNVKGNTHKPATTDSMVSACSPRQNQIKYFNELYSSNEANNFNRTAFYYALKAVDAENNMTKAGTVPTAQDNETVASMDNLERFTPAGMDLANKVVCARMLKELDAVADLISKTALCGWDYYCDYKADRFPNYLFKAKCTSENCKGNCGSHNKHNMCQSHGIHVTVLEMRGKCKEWVWGQELLPLACTCTNDVMMKAESMSG